MTLSNDVSHMPWLQPQFQQLKLTFIQNKFPHALLLTGVTGLAKLSFAKFLAQSLLCQHNDNLQACLQCHSCQLLQAGSHPDYHLLQAEQAGKVIKVDQIRSLVAKMTQTSQMSGYRIVIIEPADSMNQASANALLKGLEEPGQQTLYMLVSANQANVMATIKSRCQVIKFATPEAGVAETWLKSHVTEEQLPLLINLANGAPLLALQLYQQGFLTLREQLIADLSLILEGDIDIVAVASRWSKLDIHLVVRWLILCISDLIKCQSGQTQILNFDIKQMLMQLANKGTLQQSYRFYDRLLEVNQGLLSQINFNTQLMLEELLACWTSIDK